MLFATALVETVTIHQIILQAAIAVISLAVGAACGLHLKRIFTNSTEVN